TISLLPMFLIYSARVSNDALALLFAGLSIYLLLGISVSRTPILRAILIGLTVGFGVLTKATVLAFLPVSLVYVLYLTVSSKFSWRRCLLCGAAIITVYFAVCLPYHLHNLREF